MMKERSSVRIVRQLVFGIGWDRPGQCRKQSFVTVRGADAETNFLWAAKVLLLFRLSAAGVGDIGEYAYVQYMEVTKDRIFCLCGDLLGHFRTVCRKSTFVSFDVEHKISVSL